jgi:hypothetical protein
MDKILSVVFVLAEDIVELAIIVAFLGMILYWAAWTMETVQ